MAWMNFRGNMYHCIDCKLAVAADCDDGPKRTRIDNVEKTIQKHFHKQFMPPSYDLKRNGYYFHSGALCKTCLPHQLSKSAIVYSNRELPPYDKALWLVEEVSRELNEIMEKAVIEYASRIDARYCVNLFSLLSENPENENSLSTEVSLGEANKTIIEEFRHYLESSRDTKDHICKFQKALSKLEPELKALLQQGKKLYYQQIPCKDTTVSDSSFKTSDQACGETELFKGPYEVPKFRILKFLKKNWFDHLFTQKLRSRLFLEISRGKSMIQIKNLSEEKNFHSRACNL